MSNPVETSIDCERCEKSLVSLLYGEIDAAAAAHVRGHLDACAACRQAYDKMVSGRAFARRLPLESAPSMAKVLEAARQQAASARLAREQVRTAAPQDATSARAPLRQVAPEDDSAGSWLRWLGAIVMGPQLGVATVLLLIVGIGLWYLPHLGGGPEREPSPLLEPEPPLPVQGNALEPAAPLQLAHDPRTGRVRVDEQPAATGEEGRPAIAAGGSTAPARDSEEPRARELAAAETLVAPAAEPGSVEALPLPDLPTAAGSFEGQTIDEVRDEVHEPSNIRASASGEPTGPRVDPADDAEPFTGGPSGGELAAAALHGQARRLAAAGRCPESIARYRQLQSQHPTYPEGGRASMEMADCLRRLGRVAEARAALDRAIRSPVAEIAASARRQLTEMTLEETAERAVPATTSD
ncbi:MAG: tetratricopeptide repeat protein [Deltaproteobacteria bacterium]|jgi:predicted anti-sigma-YlaC factor YlaD